MNNHENDKRIRTIPELVKLIKEEDPESPVSEYFIRKMVKSGKLPAMYHGSKVLISVSAFYRFAQGQDAALHAVRLRSVKK